MDDAYDILRNGIDMIVENDIRNSESDNHSSNEAEPQEEYPF